MDPDAVKLWRRGERERLIALRQALPAADRRRWSERIDAELRSLLAERPGILGVYWPFRAEFDPRPLIDWAVAAGRAIALPVVVDKKGPLEYRAWRPGEPLVDGVWNIPVPENRAVVTPAIVLAPLVGFDPPATGWVMAAAISTAPWRRSSPRPLAIGIGFAIQLLETIHPQPFDVPMDLIVTETGTRRR